VGPNGSGIQKSAEERRQATHERSDFRRRSRTRRESSIDAFWAPFVGVPRKSESVQCAIS